ncbi:MAG: molybdate ABC transporter substrate-binding protein [Methylococcaceae bacterium]|jgi:molybdate transport system substrate-binding protein
MNGILIWVLGLWVGSVACADTVQVAVASNFSGVMEGLAASFERDTGHKVVIVSGATGKLYAQISNAAPFEVLLAADQSTPAKLIADGLADPSSRYTYAVGKLVLWSAKPGIVDPQGAVLKTVHYRHLALANPKTAPYGAAAIEVLSRLGVLKAWEPKWVQGENIAQTQQFIASGNAELGFIALSQIQQAGRIVTGSVWRIPEQLYSPIRQDAVLLRPGRGKAGALALMDYLRGEHAQTLIKANGYGP